MATESEAETEVNGKEAEENQEQLKYKTLVLRVSLHCEGCKRKVKKILTNTDGVYTTDIDLRQQKVTVIGDVDAETLIRKLEKNGRHAELWPESKSGPKKKKKKKKKSKSKNKEKNQQEQSDDQESSEEGKVEVLDNGGACKNVETNGAAHVVKGGQTVSFSAGCQLTVGDRKVGGESEGGVEKSGGGGGGGGEKKKKKGHKGNNGNGNVIGKGEPSGVAPAGNGSPIHVPNGPTLGPHPSPASCRPPCQRGCQYPHYSPPPHYNTPPMYAMSFNTACPRPNYGTPYYAATAPYSYAYMHPGTGIEIPPSDAGSYSSQPSDSFEVFSDENPNACSVM